MFNLLNFFKKDRLWDFEGGIHPPEMKTQSNGVPLRQLPLPAQFILPLKQHIGHEGEIGVRPGDKVLRGQPLTFGNGRMLPIHAPTSGTVTKIAPHMTAHPSALAEMCLFITPDGEDRWVDKQTLSDYRSVERSILVEKVHQAGVAGLGGAGFPTATKLKGGLRGVNTLIINAAECEPYITADDRLMQDCADDVLEGSRILAWILQAEQVLIGIEDNKPEAIAALKQALGSATDLHIRVIPTKYPSGGAKQLTKILTGKEVPHGGRSTDIGVLMQNVGTAFAVKRAIVDGEALTERVVTLTGESVAKPGNVWARLGTPISHLLQQADFMPGAEQMVVMGGPLMGFTLPTLDVPVVKITNCILAPAASEMGQNEPEQGCIRCSACADACPANLLPQELYWYSRVKEYDKAEKLNLFDCIECGACAWVCPSEIPLVQYYKIAKDDIREVRAEAEKAERAKQRFEAKQARFERDKAAREARHAEAAAQRRQAMAAAGGDDPVAAALARLKAKQEAASAETQPDNAAMMAAREARKQEALARRAAKAVEAAQPDDAGTAVVAETDPKKAAIAAALARAKAKKAVQAAGDEANNTAAAPGEPVAEPAAEVDPKKAAIAAALARAKAKKAAQTAGDGASNTAAAPSEPVAEPAPEVDPKKAAIAAAIARAKAKKAAQAAGDEVTTDSPTAPSEPVTEPATEVDPKKAAIATAIARAKAKKAAQTAGDEVAPDAPVSSSGAVSDSPAAPSEPVAEPAPEVDPKKAAIAAAIARAKAKKLAADAAANTSSPSTDKSH